MASGLGTVRRRRLQREQNSQGRTPLSLSQLRIDHRYDRLHRRLYPGLLQTQQAVFKRHHARAALDLLRSAAGAAIRLYPATTAAPAAKQRLAGAMRTAPPVNGARKQGENIWLSGA